jgi:hypothetical protein
MRATNSLARWGLAACLVGSVGLQAQDTGFSNDFKLRLGFTPTAKDNLRRNYQGFGWNLGYGLGVGRIGLELGYLYNTGDPYETTPDYSRVPVDKQAVDPTQVVEDKRNELSGFTARLSWQQKINEGWNWQAGLQIGTDFKHQYVCDVHSLGDRTKSTAAWEDTYNGTPKKGGFSNISPYAGVSWNVDSDSSLEFNLMLLRYDAIEYHHYAGTGTYIPSGDQMGLNNVSVPWRYDKLDSHNRMVPHIEIAYVFHF